MLSIFLLDLSTIYGHENKMNVWFVNILKKVCADGDFPYLANEYFPLDKIYCKSYTLYIDIKNRYKEYM